MLRPDDPQDHGRHGSLLALGDALREPEQPRASRLGKAIAEVRAEQGLPASGGRNPAAQDESPLLAALGEVPVPPSRASTPTEKTDRASKIATNPRIDGRAAADPIDTTPEEREQGWLGSVRSRLSRRKAAAERAADRPAAPAGPRPAEPAPGHAPQPARQAYADPAPDSDREDGATEPADDGRWRPLIDPVTVIRGVLRSKAIIAACTVAGAALGVLVALNTPKLYYSAAELLADPRDLNLVDRDLTGPSGGSPDAILALVENQVRVITSGNVLSRVVERLRLDQDPEFNGEGEGGFSPRALLSVFSSGGEADGVDRRTALAVTGLGRALSVERGGRTFVINIGAKTEDPEKSALIANTVGEVFLQTYGQIRSDAAGRAASELTAKLDELRRSVEAAERKVEQFKAENDIIDAQGRLITDDEIVKLNEQLGVARARTLELNARAASLRGASVDAVLGGAIPEALASPSMQELRAQYSTLKGEADRLSARLGPRHPQLQAVEAQLDGARTLIAAELRRIETSAQTELRRAVQLEQELSSRLAQLKVRQGGLSSDLVTLRELERDATSKRAVYEAFLLRARETGEQQGINSANISVISRAEPPLESEPPSRSVISIAGMMLGLMAGLGIGVARGTFESLGTRFRPAGPSVARRRVVSPPPPAPASGRGYRTMFEDRDPPLPAADDRAPSAAASAEKPEPAPSIGPDARASAAPVSPPPEPERQNAMYDRHPYGGPMQPAPQAAGPEMQPAPPMMGYPQPGYPAAGYAPVPPYPPQPAYYGQHAPYPGAMPPAPAFGQPPYGHPAGYWPGYPTPPMAAPQAAPAPEPQQAASERQIEEIRESLRECRDAIRELSEQRRRRYF
jgi:succinoglycan biosynthesis transport protein ExoP